jgi:hypothetical protein
MLMNNVTMHVEPSIKDCIDAIRVLFKPGRVVELRAFGARGLTTKKKFTLSGYYDNFDRLAEDAIRATRTAGVYGVFWTLQTIKSGLLARSANRYIEGPAATTSDADVAWYSWLPIDCDPVRPSGVSATDAEKEKALEVMERVGSFFREQGVTPVCADSGNGYHLLVAMQLGVKDAPLVASVLAALDERFSTEDAKIDRVNFNPARIFKVYGTVARKGEASEERPHRAARLLSMPDTIPTCASRELLETIAAAAAPAREKKKGKKAETEDIEKIAAKVEEFLSEGKVEHGSRLDYKDGFKWLLEKCPFNPEHVAPSIIVTVGENGAMGFRCSHNSCFDKLWLDFRKTVEAKIGHAFVFTATAPPLDPEHIVTNPGHVSEMIRRSEAVLHGFGLKYFERNNELVNTAYGRDVTKLKDIERSADSVIIQPASRETILRDLDSSAVFVRRTETSLGTIEKVVHVPKLLPDQLHDRVRSEVRAVVFPTLDMVTASPVLLPSGALHGAGKLFEEGVLFIGAHTKRFPQVPEHPTHTHALAALQQFDDIFCGFPFIDPGSEGLNWNSTASYSVALAGVLSLVARPYLGLGAMPVIGATAPSRRSGKTKIIEAACMAALGHRPTACHFTDEVEFDKHVQPLMRAGDRAILIDNVERSLQSSKLCILVTGGVLRDRVLGESRDVILKNYSVIFATGNNLVFGGDLSARAIRSDIYPRIERPESRAFSFDPVKLAQERHPELVVAALTMLRAYLLANAPWNLKREPWGGFERWDKLVSGCLTWLGAADPYVARERIITADPVRMSNLDVLEDWYLRYKDRSVSFTDIRADKGAVYESLLKHGTWDGYHARWILRRLEGQTIGGYTLQRIGGRSQFQVLKAGESQGGMFNRVEEPSITTEEQPLRCDDDDGIPF